MKKLFFLLFIFSATLLSAQQGTITGNVTDKSGSGVPGVSILIKGTSQGSITDINGDYKVSAAPDAVLVFSFIGYKTVEEPVSGRTIIDIVLEEEAIGMEEVVVVGYGTAKIKDVTGSMVIVRSDELEKQQVTNVGQLLQGKVSGMQVSTSGEPGASPQIRIRGLATVNGSSGNPLFVVDDVRMSDISFLSQNQIESVTVLKDASSAAIYGSDAARGVVLITTKKGASGVPSVTYRGYVGIQNAANMLEMVDGSQYIELYNEKNPTRPIDSDTYSGNTDWYSEVLRPAKIQNHEISISGSSDKSKYYYGIGVTSQEGLIKKNDYNRINLRGTNDITVNKYLKTGYNITLAGEVTHNPAGVLMPAYVAPPVFEVMTDGNFTGLSALMSGANPAALIEYQNSISNNVKGLLNSYVELTPIKDLSIRSSFTLDAGYYYGRTYVPEYEYGSTSNPTSSLSKSTYHQFNYTWDNLVNYQKVFGDHRLTLMGGLSYYQLFQQGMSVSADGVPYDSDATLYVSASDLMDPLGYDYGTKIRNQSYFGRVFYSYMDKYLLTLTYRVDAASNFPATQRKVKSPSVGLGWVVSDESFMSNVTFINFLKLRASYGVLGNSSIPQNLYTGTVSTGGSYSVTYGPYGTGIVSQGASVTTAVQPNLRWEVVNEYDFGIETKMAANRLSLDFDLYRRMTVDAIFPYPLYATSGMSSSSFLDNVADVLNTGVEMTFKWEDKISDKLSYNFGGNVALNHNEIYSLAPGTVAYYTGNAYNGNLAVYNQIGHPVGEFYVYEVAGVFQTDEEVDNYVNSEGTVIMPSAQPGDLKFVDQNDDGAIDNFDRVSAGSYIPKGVYGFNLGVNYGDFDFSADFQGVWGNKIYNAKRAQRYGNESWDLDFYENRWHGEGTSNTYPSANVGGRMNAFPSTFFVESGSYLRIRNVQLGYTIPKSIVERIEVSSVRAYLSLQNPFTFFSYNGFSPEVPTGSVDAQGMDYNVYPITSITSIGLVVNF